MFSALLPNLYILISLYNIPVNYKYTCCVSPLLNCYNITIGNLSYNCTYVHCRPRTSSGQAPPSRGASRPSTNSANIKAKPQIPVSSLIHPRDRHTESSGDDVDHFKIDVGQTVQRLEMELDDVSITSPTHARHMDTVSVGLDDILPGATENMGSGEKTL